MKFCICCGCEMEDEDTFCINCGVVLCQDLVQIKMRGSAS